MARPVYVSATVTSQVMRSNPLRVDSPPVMRCLAVYTAVLQS